MTTLSGDRHSIVAPLTENIGAAKTQAASVLGHPPEQQQWLIEDQVLDDSELLEDRLAAAAASRTLCGSPPSSPLGGSGSSSLDSSGGALDCDAVFLQVLCLLLPTVFSVLVKVIHFTPPAVSETVMEMEVSLAPTQTVASIKEEILGKCGRRGMTGVRLLKGGLDMQDDRVVSSYRIVSGDTLHCVMCRPRSAARERGVKVGFEAVDEEPPPPQHLKVEVKTTIYIPPGPSTSGPLLELELQPGTTAQALKALIAERCGVADAVGTARLLRDGVAMLDDHLLEASDVTEAPFHFISIQPSRRQAAPSVTAAAMAAGGRQLDDAPAAPLQERNTWQDRSTWQEPQVPIGQAIDSDADDDLASPANAKSVTVCIRLGNASFEVSVQLDATVGMAKDAASSRLGGAVKELQRWTLLDSQRAEELDCRDGILDNAMSVLSLHRGDASAAVQVRCAVLPRQCGVCIKVLYFAPPAFSEAGPDIVRAVSRLQTVESLKSDIARHCGLPETTKMLVQLDRLQMKDEKHLGEFPFDDNDVLRCVIYKALSDWKPAIAKPRPAPVAVPVPPPPRGACMPSPRPGPGAPGPTGSPVSPGAASRRPPLLPGGPPILPG